MLERDKPFLDRWRIGLIGVFALSILLYLPSLKGALIWDDEGLVNGVSAGTDSIVSAFTRPFLNYFRPLTSVSFFVDTSYARGNPPFYHQTNILLHAATAVLLCWLVLILTKKKLAGILTGVFFLAQPMQVGATAWIGGRTDVLSAFFLVLFMISLVRYHETSKSGWLAGSVLAYLLAALSKEQAAAILPAVPISVFVFGSRKWKDVWRLCIPFGFAVLLYAGLWVYGGPKLMKAPNGPIDTVVLALRTASHYALAFLTPNDPSMVSFTLDNYTGFLWLVLGAVSLAGLAAFVRAMWKRHRPIAWLTVCGLLVYLPVSNFPTVPSFTVGPFRVAESGTVVACLFGIGSAYAISSKRYLLLGALGANLIAGVIVTWWGIHQWLNPPDFFSVVADNDPYFMMGVQFHARYLDGAGKFDESVRVTDKMIRWAFGTDNWLDWVEAHKSNAITPEIEMRLRSNGGRPNIQPFANFIGSNAYSLARMHRVPEAIRVAKAALIVSPNDYWLNFLAGELVYRSDPQQAVRYWENALKFNPYYTECAVTLAHERVREGQFAAAVSLLTSVQKALGTHGNPWLDMADAKIGLHDLSGAMQALDKAEQAQLPANPTEIASRRKRIQDILAFEGGKRP